MSDKILKVDVEDTINRYIGAFYDTIQEIREKKENSIDINLDIEMKINTKCHQILVALKRELLK